MCQASLHEDARPGAAREVPDVRILCGLRRSRRRQLSVQFGVHAPDRDRALTRTERPRLQRPEVRAIDGGFEGYARTVQSGGFVDDLLHCNPERIQLLHEHGGRFDETMSRHVHPGTECTGATQHRHPFGRVRGPHRREDTVQIRFAQERDAFTRQMNHEIATRVCPPEEQHVNRRAAQIQLEPILYQNVGQCSTRGIRFGTRRARPQHLGRRRMRDDQRRRRKRSVACRVIAMIGSNDHMRDRPVGDLADLRNQSLRFLEIALAVRHQNTRLRHDDQAHRREALLACRPKLLVRVHIL
jgi:hypothetical protein